jgi:hypothetical protein
MLEIVHACYDFSNQAVMSLIGSFDGETIENFNGILISWVVMLSVYQTPKNARVIVPAGNARDIDLHSYVTTSYSTWISDHHGNLSEK